MVSLHLAAALGRARRGTHLSFPLHGRTLYGTPAGPGLRIRVIPARRPPGRAAVARLRRWTVRHDPHRTALALRANTSSEHTSRCDTTMRAETSRPPDRASTRVTRATKQSAPGPTQRRSASPRVTFCSYAFPCTAALHVASPRLPGTAVDLLPGTAVELYPQPRRSA
jgi:hypothetical protein